mgnify:CR=1 FL=1
MQLIIVESPTKAKTISRFLDNKKYQVESSYGHIRDLPVSQMGVDVEHDFKPEYVIPKDKAKIINQLKKLGLFRPITDDEITLPLLQRLS